MPDDINAVIIDNVLNGSEVYGSGRRLARAMLPISGGMCTSSTQLFSTATTTGRCSTRSAPPRPPTHLVDALTLVTSHHSFEHEGEGTDTLRLSAATRGPNGPTSYYHISNFYGYASPHGGATVRVSH